MKKYKQCKAITELNQRCIKNAVIGGYCTLHFKFKKGLFEKNM